MLNEDSHDSDTRIEGNGDANLLYIDAGTDRVGIGDAAPGEKLDVAGNVNVTGVYKVDDVQVVKEQQSAIASAKVDYTTGDLDTEAEVISAFNTTNGKINDILGALRTHGLIAT